MIAGAGGVISVSLAPVVPVALNQSLIISYARFVSSVNPLIHTHIHT